MGLREGYAEVGYCDGGAEELNGSDCAVEV